jgi:predicted TIM-barrel fold metal-dependent hydrolase
MYHDTAVGGSFQALRCGYDVFGPDNVIFGTDYPWGPKGGEGRLSTYVKLVEKLGLPELETRKILELNARRIAKIG